MTTGAQPNHGVKQFVAGAFIALCMTGLDQDMMQKNLSCRSLRDAQVNMASFSSVLVVVNLLFLGLGALLLLYTEAAGISVERADLFFATVALDGNLGTLLPILFLLGLVAAALSSADSALTALTTSVCVDFLGMSTGGTQLGRRTVTATRALLGVRGVGVLILAFHAVNDTSVIAAPFKVASYTYGPLLGLFAFALTRRAPRPGDWTGKSCRHPGPDLRLGIGTRGRPPPGSASALPFFRSTAPHMGRCKLGRSVEKPGGSGVILHQNAPYGNPHATAWPAERIGHDRHEPQGP